MEQQLEQWARKLLSWHEDEACIGDCTTADRLRDVLAIVAEVRSLREQVAGLDREVKRGYIAERDYQAANLKLSAERYAAQATIDGLVDMAKANPTQPLAHALRTVAIVSPDSNSMTF